MDLWIRSQDKKALIKVSGAIISVIEHTEFNANNSTKSFCISGMGDVDYVLGFYDTEKRALKIIDEIQEILYPNLFAISKDMVENGLTKSFSNSHILTRNHNEVNIYERQSCVYEMPKE